MFYGHNGYVKEVGVYMDAIILRFLGALLGAFIVGCIGAAIGGIFGELGTLVGFCVGASWYWNKI